MNYELLLKKPSGIEPWDKSSARLLKYDKTLHFWTNFKFALAFLRRCVTLSTPTISRRDSLPTDEFKKIMLWALPLTADSDNRLRLDELKPGHEVAQLEILERRHGGLIFDDTKNKKDMV